MLIPSIFHPGSIDVNEYEGASYIATIIWDSRRATFVIILLRQFSGQQSLLLGPSTHARDYPFVQTERERKRGIQIRQATPQRVSVSSPPPGHHRSRHRLRPAGYTGSSTYHRLYQNSYQRATYIQEEVHS